MMAEGSVLLRLQPRDLQCTVCMGYYQWPSTLPCGHTFCRGCIERCWGVTGPWICPLCQKSFPSRPELSKNTDLAGLLEALHAQEPQEHGNCPQCAGPGATTLCLPCMVPLCTEHRPLHRGEAGTRRHLLVTGGTAAWPCRGHERGLQYFCIEHSAPVCPVCVLQHKECRTQPLMELYRKNKERLDGMICDLDVKISCNEEEISSRKNAYREIQILICDMKDNLTRDFREMRDYLEKQERASFWRMQQEQEAAHTAMSQQIHILLATIEGLKKVKVALQDRLQNDWMAVLKDSGSEGIFLPASPPKKQYTFDENRLVDTTDAIGTIRKSLLSHPLLEQIPCPPRQVFEETLVLQAPTGSSVLTPSTNLPERRLNRLLQWATHISFDPQTVNSRLCLTQDLKTVTVTTKINQYGSNERRFTTSQVSGAPGFSTECCYWEFSTRDSDGWGIGAAAAEMGRDGKLGRNNVSWCVEWNKDQLCAWHNNQVVPLSLPRPITIGVLLNCQENDLKFYSISDDGETLIHSFTVHCQSQIFPIVWLYGLKPGNSLTIQDIQRIQM